MRQINNGFAEYYYLKEDGQIYNSNSNKLINADKEHIFRLNTIQNTTKKIALKSLYRLVYNKPFSIDTIVNLEGEQWKEVEDSNGFYYVSNKGRVKSYYGYEAIILKGYVNQRDYERVDINIEGRRQTILVHRLVADAFLPLPKKITYQLHHKDFNRHNNTADNLEWISPAAHYKLHTTRKFKEKQNFNEIQQLENNNNQQTKGE